VRLRAGETWTFEPPAGHTVAWAHACSGVLRVAGTKFTRELVAFSESEDAIEFVAQDDAEFIVASAVRHPYPLVTGYYSVHTSEEALLKGETEIARIGQTLRSQGRLR
jgi:redox-sensitive bicupin YhaK (pirin superfamily)